MTFQGNFKRLVRERMAQTGEKYTQARRVVAAEQGPQLHYLFTPPRTIERVHGFERRELLVPERAGPAFAWGYAGSGPVTSAWAVLEDATGDCDNRLAVEFVGDNLDWEELAAAPFVITADEIRAWRTARESEIRAEPSMQLYSARDLANLMTDYLENGHGRERPWWELHRERHGSLRLN